MSEPRADVALLVDFTDLRLRLCPGQRGTPAPETGTELAPDETSRDQAAPDETSRDQTAPDETSPDEASPDEAAPDEASPDEIGAHAGVEEAPGEPPAGEVARQLVRFADGLGRLAIARAYADWSRCGSLAQEVSRERLEPILVPGTGDGEDRSHIRLVVDALEALFCGDEPDAFVLVTGDSTLLPLVLKLKADGAEVVVVAPSSGAGEELRRNADRFFAIEEVLNGAEADAIQPRTWRSVRGGGSAVPDGEALAQARPDRSPHPTPVHSEAEFTDYEWAPFIRLIDELEHRLPFVGVRYLVNKVLGLHNCGVEDPRLKRDLINRAVDRDLIEMYPVGNVGDRADPVTACRLNRICEMVIVAIGETARPEGPPEHAPDDEEDPEDHEHL